jgi:hypothetical protein
MTAVPVEKHLQHDSPARLALRPVADLTSSSDEARFVSEDFQPWEIHSELVLVDPELRGRSLELLPEIDLDPAPARAPQPILLAPLAPAEPIAPPVPAAALATAEDEPAFETVGIFRYAVHRVVDITRLGLAIVGAVFALAMLAELVAR